MVDRCCLLVGELIDAIERVWFALWSGGGNTVNRWLVLTAIRCHGTGVGKGTAGQVFGGGLQQGDGPDHVDARTPDRVGFAERYLEGGEVDDMRRLVLAKAGLNGGGIGDVQRVKNQTGRSVSDKVT